VFAEGLSGFKAEEDDLHGRRLKEGLAHDALVRELDVGLEVVNRRFDRRFGH
jgi:hypothetical protein